jgi:hypothetical protein
MRADARVIVGIAAAVALGAVFAARSADPFAADPAAAAALRSTIASHRGLADGRLATLRSLLSSALTDGRHGAALTVQGTQRPGPDLSAAAQAVTDADPLVADATAALRSLAGDLAVSGKAGPAPAMALLPGQLTSIGAQLKAASGAADAFWSKRRATETTLLRLQDAFAAVDAGSPERGLAAIDEAQASLEVVRNWAGAPLTLPIWTQAAGNLLTALKDLAVAVRDRDSAAARAAGARYWTASAEAHRADLALAVAIAEGGSAVSDSALASAVSALRAVEAALAEVRSILT